MNTNNINFKKAILSMAFLFSAQPGFSQTTKATIASAQELTLQKNRNQAITLLVSALNKEKKPQAMKELSQALEEISTVFYSDKAQQTFELALSLKHADLAAVPGKLAEAAKVEPENFLIILEQMRNHLTNNDCSKALSAGAKARELNPYFEPINLATAQALLCQGQFEAYLKVRNLMDIKKTGLASFWLVTEIEHAFKTGAFAKGKDLITLVQKMDPQYPESSYWQWKIENELKMRSDRASQKYLAACKSLNGRQQRTYSVDPYLCKRVSEVESSAKKNNNANI